MFNLDVYTKSNQFLFVLTEIISGDCLFRSCVKNTYLILKINLKHSEEINKPRDSQNIY